MQIKIICFLFCFLSLFVQAQLNNKEDLQKQEEKLRIELKELNDKLVDAKKNKKLSLKQVALIKNKIEIRQKLKNKIIEQLNIINNHINKNQQEINVLSSQLSILKNQYAQNIVIAYKKRYENKNLNYILSANSFNESFKRIRYFRNYNFYKSNLKNDIVSTKDDLFKNTIELNENKKLQEKTIKKSTEEISLLHKDKVEQDRLVNEYKDKEVQFERQLKEKEAQRRKMQKLIFDIIKKETEEAIRKEKLKKELLLKKENNKEKSNVPNTKEGLKNLKNVRPYSALENSENDIETSISFENNKGKLPWPVEKGNVDVHFGISTIPDTKLTRKSDGIEISVPKGSAVKNVANGKVTSVGELNGEKFVMIFHGKYISVYRHLSNVYVKVNQEIKGRTLIGTSGIGIDGEGTLLFMIANDKGEPLNPEIWLKKQH